MTHEELTKMANELRARDQMLPAEAMFKLAWLKIAQTQEQWQGRIQRGFQEAQAPAQAPAQAQAPTAPPRAPARSPAPQAGPVGPSRSDVNVGPQQVRLQNRPRFMQ